MDVCEGNPGVWHRAVTERCIHDLILTSTRSRTHHVFELVKVQRRALPALAGVHKQTGDRVAERTAPGRVSLTRYDCPELRQGHLQRCCSAETYATGRGHNGMAGRALTGTSMRAAYSSFAFADCGCVPHESMNSAKGTCDSHSARAGAFVGTDLGSP